MSAWYFRVVDPEFQKALTIVLAVGLGIAAVGTIVLFFVFRAFGEKGAGGSSHVGLIGALIAFVFICCVALFRLAYAAN